MESKIVDILVFNEDNKYIDKGTAYNTIDLSVEYNIFEITRNIIRQHRNIKGNYIILCFDESTGIFVCAYQYFNYEKDYIEPKKVTPYFVKALLERY